MASVSDLNIRMGVLYRDFDKSLRQVENRMRQSAQTIGSIADSMTSAFTIPFAALGGLAIKASGDFEGLRLAMNTTMEDAGYSTQQVTKELEELRKVALAPGIDLEQAVKGSIRLQSVGISAEKARETLTQVANAIAAAGGSAENLNSVTVQLAQMSAKGVVMASDLRIIQEAMPGVTKAMQQAFGQSTAEGIRDAGISANEFIDGITEQLAKNARVQGGIKNAIDNARSAFMQFFATIGDGINEAYNLNAVADTLFSRLNSMAMAFKNLDPETKKAILNFALYAAAAGPVIKAISGIFAAGQTLVSGLRVVGGGLKNLTEVAENAVAGFGKLSTAMKFTYVGAAIAIVAGLYLAFQKLSDNVNQALHVTTLLNEVERTANDQVSEQKVQVESLIGVLENENRTKEEKRAAIAKLNEISPEYFKGLKLEGDNVRGLKEAYDAYIDNLLKAARVKAAEEKLIEIDRKKLKLQEDLLRQEQSRVANFQATTGGLGSVAAFEQQSVNTKKQLVDEINREISAVKNEEQALKNVIESNLILEPTQQKTIKATQAAAEASGKKKKATDEETASMKDLIKTLDQLDANREQLNKAERGNDPINQPLKTIPQARPEIVSQEEVKGSTDVLLAWAEAQADVTENAGANFLRLQEIMEGWGDQWQITGMEAQAMSQSLGASFVSMVEAFSRGGEAQQQIFDAVGASIMSLTNEGSVNMKDFAKSAAASAIKVAKAYAVQGIFAAVSKALQNVPFPLNLVAAGAAAGIAGALLNGLANRIQAPALAKGGLAYGPTMAMVGDNPGASVDPEVISPLSKLQSIMGSAGSSVFLNGKFVIRGQDLELVLAKAQKTQSRIR